MFKTIALLGALALTVMAWKEKDGDSGLPFILSAFLLLTFSSLLG